MGQAPVDNDHGETVSYGIRRCEFDAYLLDRVSASKQLNTPVKSIEQKGRNWVINDAFEAPLLIGVTSKYRRWSLRGRSILSIDLHGRATASPECA